MTWEERERVCVCVCVCVRERERERERERVRVCVCERETTICYYSVQLGHKINPYLVSPGMAPTVQALDLFRLLITLLLPTFGRPNGGRREVADTYINNY